MAYYTPRVQDDSDPLEGGVRIPSLSWKALPVGTVFTCEVLEPAKLLQSRDYESNQPKFWDEAKTQPVMAAVINVRVTAGPHSVGEDRSIWAQKPSSLFVALADAQKAAGVRIARGGVLQLRFAAETPHTNPRNNPIKNYQARYTPPVASPDHDAFADTPPARSAPPVRPADAAWPVATTAPALQATPAKPQGW